MSNSPSWPTIIAGGVAVVAVVGACGVVAWQNSKGGKEIATNSSSFPKMSRQDAREMKRKMKANGQLKSTMSKQEAVELRSSLTCSNLSVSYSNTGALMMEAAFQQWMWEEEGDEVYLDTRNNVAHVGHSHPVVVQAVQEQFALLNTNTRYLHPSMLRLAQRLRSNFPPNCPLREGKVFFVNSGSEANDLALRIARHHHAVTRNKQKGNGNGNGNEEEEEEEEAKTIVLERAYHGNTVACVEISPYKTQHVRYIGRQPRHVLVTSCPDVFNARRKMQEERGGEDNDNNDNNNDISDDDLADRFASNVESICDKYRGNIAAFIIESGLSVGGVIIPPKGYLSRCFRAVKEGGGVCIADEVQTALGRLGKFFFAFEASLEGDLSPIYPDIVTIGKPLGNSYPIAAVIISQTLADYFDKGVEYFNTFGGGPSAAAAANAVLDVIERENLRQHAEDVGCYLKTRLIHLSSKLLSLSISLPVVIGDVRGMGLFVGVEFVEKRNARQGERMAIPYYGKPSPNGASMVCSRLKQVHFILSSLDGLNDNVMVFKPPMCFQREDVDELVAAIEECLMFVGRGGGGGGGGGGGVGHTPT